MHPPTAQSSPARSRNGRTQQGPLTPPPSPPAHFATEQQQQHHQQQRYHSPPQRASCSSYDDPRHPHISHSPPNRARHAGEQRRLSGHGLPGPRLPPLPAGAPTGADFELFERRRLSTASGGSSRRGPRNSGLSLEVRSASPVYSQNRASTYSFLEGPPPPPRRDSRRFSGSLETPAEENGRRPSLLPRSALRTDDCFGLDFSFLDDEPPPRPDYSTRRPSADVGPFGRSPMAFPSTRRTSVASDRSVIDRIRDSVELESPRSPARSFNSAQSLPFPSRPRNLRTESSESILTSEQRVTRQESSFYNPGTFSPGSSLGPPVDSTRRPSVVSDMSMESTDSSAPSGYGLLMPSDLESPTESNFSTSTKGQLERGPEDLEKRKRLAAFLDQTAEAMEGGRSLAMVLPEACATASEPAKSMSELAESIASPQLAPPIEYTHPCTSPFTSPAVVPSDGEEGSRSPRNNSRLGFNLPDTASIRSGQTSTPGTPTPAPIARNRSPATSAAGDNRRTVYFTPDPNSSRDEEDGSSGSDPGGADDEGGDDDGGDDGGRTPARKQSAGGLGFNIDIKTESTLSNAPATANLNYSPTTLRAPSPSESQNAAPSAQVVPVISVEAAREMEKRAKVAEKRKRTIRELIDTEASYATDMVVVRDIYLARAKGVAIDSIADRVMDSGLGLGGSAASPPSPMRSGGNSLSASVYPGNQSPAARSDIRRASMLPTERDRRPSTAAPSFSAKLEQRRATLAATRIEATAPSQALMSTKDLHIVFANLEEVAGLAETFARVLEGAKGSEDPDEMDDRIGEVFIQMIHRIEKIYSTYCSRHDRAIVRLQELEPTLRGYFAECKTLSSGRTNAWDLGSLLIKPVQRCLKYPLLLDQILAVTPEDHPDRLYLQRANEKMLGVAEHINEQKQRHRQVERLAPKKDSNGRRDSTRSISSAVTKKFLRASLPSKPSKPAPVDSGERDDMFDTLAHLVDSTRSAVLRFSNEMRDWSRTTKAGLEAQVTMVDGWIELYAPMADDSESSLYNRLCIFLEEVLDPIIDGPWRELDHEIRRSLLLKTDHLLSLFESPRQFIAKRNDKMLEHARYLAKKLPADRRGSEEFVDLSTRLLQELPRFLGSVSRYYDIIVGHFGGAQEAYHEAVEERWMGFAEQFEPSPEGSYNRDSYGSQQQAASELMNRLAAGLGVAITTSAVTSPAARKRISRLSGISAGSNGMSPPSTQRHSLAPSPEDRRLSSRPASTAVEYSAPPSARDNRSSLVTNRSSVTSDSSVPSFALSSNGGGSSTGGPTTPPPLTAIPTSNGHLKIPPNAQHRHSTGSNSLSPPRVAFDHRRHSSLVAARYEAPLPSVPIQEAETEVESSACSESSEGEGGNSPSVVTFRKPVGHGRSPLGGRQLELEEEEEQEGEEEEDEVPRLRAVKGRQRSEGSEEDEKWLSTYSVYVEAGEGFEDSDEEEEEEGGEEVEVLYTAEAMRDTSAPQAHRSGFPILAFKLGERFDVELEEADHASGGAGWLLGRTADGVLGWGRTEDFSMA